MADHRFSIPRASVGQQQATGLQHGATHLFATGYSRLIVAGTDEIEMTLPPGPAGFMPFDTHGITMLDGIPAQYVTQGRRLIALTAVHRAGMPTPETVNPNRHGRVMTFFWCHMAAMDERGGWWSFHNRFSGGRTYLAFKLRGGIDTYYVTEQTESLKTTMHVTYHLLEVED